MSGAGWPSQASIAPRGPSRASRSPIAVRSAPSSSVASGTSANSGGAIEHGGADERRTPQQHVERGQRADVAGAEQHGRVGVGLDDADQVLALLGGGGPQVLLGGGRPAVAAAVVDDRAGARRQSLDDVVPRARVLAAAVDEHDRRAGARRGDGERGAQRRPSRASRTRVTASGKTVAMT